MSETKHIGSFYERRGDDYLSVNATTDGDILEVEQFDAIRRRHMSVNFFAESAPKLIALISKAAGLPKEEPVEYEYAMEIERFGVKLPVLPSDWATLETAQERLKFYTEAWALNGNDEYNTGKLVKRRKAGGIEDV